MVLVFFFLNSDVHTYGTEVAISGLWVPAGTRF